MNKINIQSKTTNISRKIKSISLFKKIIICLILLVFVLGIVFISIVIISKNNQPAIKKEIVKPSTTSKISVSTDTLFIKEWNLEVPVNGNILGTVTYTISDNNTKVHLISSQLNNTVLSTSRCKELGITKDSWGISRSVKKASYAQNKSPFIIGNYAYQRSFPSNICSSVSKIDAAFNYLFIHLAEKR